MRTPRELYHGTPIVYSCELDVCLKCGEPLKVAYVSAGDIIKSCGLARVSKMAYPCWGHHTPTRPEAAERIRHGQEYHK